MKKRILLWVVTMVVLVVAAVVLLHGTNIDILNPQGPIAGRQRDLLVFTFLLSLVVIVPVFVLLFVISWKFRAGNSKNTKYTPDWDGSRRLETIWWGIPIAIILILSVVTWRTSHELDPYKPLASSAQPITIEVVALQWKWLFLYPDQHIATVNYVSFPEKTPVNFRITADAPMNSFWIPSLGGQVYAMSGMTTQLHLSADTVGSYDGSSANISGEGFAKMRFTAQSRSRADFDAWVQKTKSSADLTMDAYTTLAKPGVSAEPAYYALSDTGLYDKIVMKYMAPSHKADDTKQNPMPEMPESMPAMKGM